MMGGTPKKPDKPRPSYEGGRVRDPKIEELQREAAEDDQDQGGTLKRLIRLAVGRRG